MSDDKPQEPQRGRSISRRDAPIVVPRDHPVIEIAEEEFPPDDARAMSPRRDSALVERLGKEARQSLQDHAKVVQSSLQALDERIEEVKMNCDKLESENQSLQGYISCLTQTISASQNPSEK